MHKGKIHGFSWGNIIFSPQLSLMIYTNMVYHKVMLGPSQGQMMDLTSGETVKLGAHHLIGSITLSLTTAQKKKIDAAIAAGRGTTLKFSATQIRHHAKQGEGVIRDLANAGVAMLKPIARKGIFAGLDAGKDFIQDKAENLLGLKDKQKQTKSASGKGFFGNLLRKGAHGLVDVVGDTVGLGARPANIRPRHGLIQKPLGPIGDMTGGHALGNAIARGRGGKQTKTASGKGFFGNLLRRGAHGLVDVVGDTVGLGLPNPLANANEQLNAALYQKKVEVAIPRGAGLYLPGK